MASFTLTATSTVARNLIDGEYGFVGPSGSLTVDGIAVTGTGDNDLTVLGSVVGRGGGTILHGLGDTFALSVGEAGYIGLSTIGFFSTLNLTTREQIRIDNAGTIVSAGANAIAITESDGAVFAKILNSGVIQGKTAAIAVDNGSVLGGGGVFNTGTIMAEGYGVFQSPNATAHLSLTNSGSLMGGIAFFGGKGTNTVINNGTITGTVFLGDGENTFNTVGGSVAGYVVSGKDKDTITIAGDLDGGVNTGGGDDVIRLMSGVITEQVSGNSGNDLYQVRGDYNLREAKNKGIDTVEAWVSHALEDNFEKLKLKGGLDLSGTGNALKNTIFGNNADNRLSGHKGNDTISGKNGADVIRGGLGNDKLAGDAGGDTLIGGFGKDTMTGGTGPDTFVFQRPRDAGATNKTADRITDFTSGEDLIDLTALVEGRFKLNIGGGFAANGPSVRTKMVSGTTWVEIDTDADGTRDMVIRLDGTAKVEASDFLL